MSQITQAVDLSAVNPDLTPELMEEVDAIIEPAISRLLDEEAWETRDWGGHTLWFYEFPQGTLWGATARMVRDLLEYFR